MIQSDDNQRDTSVPVPDKSAAITATGADIDNDHADEKPLDRSQDAPDDTQDVVDHISQMERSGQIDMDAYRGERNDDDEAEMLGQSGMEPEDMDEHGNKPREASNPVE